MNSTDDQHRWWHDAVLYQLYVRSWLDTDGDDQLTQLEQQALGSEVLQSLKPDQQVIVVD